MVGVYVGVHSTGVGGEESYSRGVKGKGLELRFKLKGALEIRGKQTAEWLELLVHPASEAVRKATGDGDNRACLPGSLVDLRRDVKIGEGVVYFNGSVEVDDVIFGEDRAKGKKEIVDLLVG
jgi:hypothetical protein